MTPETPNLSRDEIARLGRDLITRVIEPAHRPADDHKFVAVDVVTGDYEIDRSDHTAITRLRTRLPNALGWLGRIGHKAVYRVGPGRIRVTDAGLNRGPTWLARSSPKR